MKTISNKWMAATVLVAAALGFSAWKAADTGNKYHDGFNNTSQDTTLPRQKSSGKKEYKLGNLDEAMKDLDRAMADMDKNLKFDFSKMEKEMKQAMEELKKVDFDKIGHEIEASLKEINWEKTRVEVDKAMREAERSLKEIDMEKVKRDISKAKEQLDAEKIAAHIDIDKIKKNVDDGLAKARIGLDKARKELTLLKEFTNELEKDGLIDKKKGYKIEIKKGELYINGTKQSKEVNEKYKKYFKDEDYTLRSDGDDVIHI